MSASSSARAGRAGLGLGADGAVARGAQRLELAAQGAFGVRGALALGRQRGLDLGHALALDLDGGLGLHAGRGVALDLLARRARGDRQLAGELGQRVVARVAGVGADAQLLDLAAQHGDRRHRGGLGGQAAGQLLADRQRIGLGLAHGGPRRVALGDDLVEMGPQRIELGLGVEQPARRRARAQIDDTRLLVVGRERGLHRGRTLDPAPDGYGRGAGSVVAALVADGDQRRHGERQRRRPTSSLREGAGAAGSRRTSRPSRPGTRSPCRTSPSPYPSSRVRKRWAMRDCSDHSSMNPGEACWLNRPPLVSKVDSAAS